MFVALFVFILLRCDPSGWASTQTGFCIDRGAILSRQSGPHRNKGPVLSGPLFRRSGLYLLFLLLWRVAS